MEHQLYNALAPEVIADPFPFYHRLRQKGPVCWDHGRRSWMLTGYRECREVLSDTGRFGSDIRKLGAEIPAVRLSVQTVDPPEHRHLRHLLVSALHEQTINGLNRQIGAIVTERLDRLRNHAGTIDLVEHFARPVALATISCFLGVAPPDTRWFEELSNAVVRSMDARLDPSRAAPGNRARAELTAFVTAWLDGASTGGFVGTVRRALGSEREIPAELVLNSFRVFVNAGYDSTSRLLGIVLGRLTNSPELVCHASEPQTLDALVDELIRLDGPVQAISRVCVTDCDLAPYRFHRGDQVTLLLAAANRDPAVFPAPDEVRLDRRPGTHLSFGRGAHACLGAHMAVLELQTILEYLLATGARLRPVGAPVWDTTATLRGLRHLPVQVVDL